MDCALWRLTMSMLQDRNRLIDNMRCNGSKMVFLIIIHFVPPHSKGYFHP